MTRITNEAMEAAVVAFRDAHPEGVIVGRHEKAIRAVLEAAEPHMTRAVPTQEQIDALLREHTVGAFGSGHSACSCDRRWRTHAAYRQHLRDALLALLNGGES
jgi:hypothetical protein